MSLLYSCDGKIYCAHVCIVLLLAMTTLQAGISDKASHEMAEKILIEMGEFFQIQVSHLYY